MGKKLYEETQEGGICFKSERKPWEVRVPNYVYDLWMPVLGVVDIGVYNVYCRLERENVVKAISLGTIARACRIGKSRLYDTNKRLEKCGFIRIAPPEGWQRLAHYTTEITVLDPPQEVPAWAIKEYCQLKDGYQPLSPWLVQEDETQVEPAGVPNGTSGETGRDAVKEPEGTPKVVTLGLQPLGVELVDVEANFFIKKPKTPAPPAPSPGGGADSGKLGGNDARIDATADTGGDGAAIREPDTNDHQGRSSETEADPVTEAIIEQEQNGRTIWDDWGCTVAARAAAGGNWADAGEDGADVAETALARFCDMQGEAPNDDERQSMLRELAEILKPLRVTVDIIDNAFDIMVEDFGYRVGNYNVFQDSFKRDMATCIRRARGKKQPAQPDRAARYDTPAVRASQAALAERMAARDPPVEGDPIWEAAKREIALQMTRVTFDTWVRDTYGLPQQDGVYTVMVPDKRARDWLDDRLKVTAQRTLVGILDEQVEVRFEVQPEEVE